MFVAGDCVKYNGVDNTMENVIRTSWIWIFYTDTRGWPSARTRASFAISRMLSSISFMSRGSYYIPNARRRRSTLRLLFEQSLVISGKRIDLFAGT